MTDIIERVAEALYTSYADVSGDGPYSTAGDFSQQLARKQSTAALEELAKGLVWDDNKLSLNGMVIYQPVTMKYGVDIINYYRKRLFGLGPKEG